MGGTYLRWRIGVADEASGELVVALLGEVGFEAFETVVQEGDGSRLMSDDGVIAEQLVIEAYGAAEIIGQTFHAEWLGENQAFVLWIDGPHEIPNTNWNAEWESNFQPVRLGTSLGLRAPFHQPMEEVDLELVVMPRMSFGTGHHETTLLMIWWLLGAPSESAIQIGQSVLWPNGPQKIERPLGLLQHENLHHSDSEIIRMCVDEAEFSRTTRGFIKGARVLDMGCGTGILGILAAKLGAVSVIGIDVEAWSVENSAENAARNAGPAQGLCADWLCGDASLLYSLTSADGAFDLILANINRNVLLNDMKFYCAALAHGGQLWLSGFYGEDHIVLLREAGRLGLVCFGSASLNQWSTLLFEKK